MSKRFVVDCGDGVEVHACADSMTPELREALRKLGRALALSMANEEESDAPE